MATRKKSTTKTKPKARAKIIRYGHRSQDRILQQTKVYLMGNFPFIFLCKFGVSDEVDQRVKDVSATTPGSVFMWLNFNLSFGYEVEQFIHGLYRFQNFHFWTGSGRTEWFFVFSPIVGTSHLFVCWYFGIDQSFKMIALGYCTPFLWLDGLFWLLLFKIIGAVFMIAFIFFMVYAIAHIKS